MARITVEDCLEKEPNRFSLVQLASKRSKQLLTGARPLVDVRKGNKAVVNALREIASGLVRFKTEQDLAEERVLFEKRRQAELQMANARVTSAGQESSATASLMSQADALFKSASDSSSDSQGSSGSQGSNGDGGSQGDDSDENPADDDF